MKVWLAGPSLLALALVVLGAPDARATGMIAQQLRAPGEVIFADGRLAGHGDDVLVGAPCSSGPEKEDFVYVFDGATGAVELALPSPTGITCDAFGASVGSVGGDILVGSPFAPTGPGTVDGAVYLFDGATGELLRTIPSPVTTPAGAGFGARLAVAGSEAFVLASRAPGAPGAAPGAVYRIDVATGDVLTEFLNPEPPRSFGDFGAALAAGAGRLVVGDPIGGPNFSGLVQVFDVASGAHVDTLDGPSGVTLFGEAVAVAAGRIAVGAPLGPDVSSPDQDGAVFLFDAASLAPVQTLLAPEVPPFSQTNFGNGLGVFGDDFLVTAPNAPMNDQPFGGAYLLDGASGEILYRFHAFGIGTSIDAAGGRVVVSTLSPGPDLLIGYLFETCASLGEGAACDDGNGCDTGDVCVGGLCVAGSPVVCEGAPGICRRAGCEPASGLCHTRVAPNGSSCFPPPYVCSVDSTCFFGQCLGEPDPDSDGDLVCGHDDVCPIVADPGQEDADADGRGDVCDASDAHLVIHRAAVRASGRRPASGRLRIRGELISRPDQAPLDAGEGLVVRVTDEGSAFTQIHVWSAEDCAGAAPATVGCRRAGPPMSRIELRPLAHQVDGFVVYRFTLVARGLELEAPPVGPLEVTITSQPPRPVAGFDRAGRVAGCRARGTRLTCSVAAEAP